jgi:hypothetical protein
MTAHGGEEIRHAEIRSEKRDTNPRAIVRFLLWLVFASVAVAILLRWMFVGLASYEEAKQPPPPVLRQAAPEIPPGPLLQERPAQDLGDFRAAEEKSLHGYAWVDKQAGIVQIDVDRAMELTLERGLPVRPQPSPSDRAGEPGREAERAK